MAFFDKENRMVSGIPCAVASCKATRRSHPYRKFYGFPKEDSELFGIWVQQCSIPNELTGKKLIICEKHFDESDKGKRKLRKNVTPKLYLADSAIIPEANTPDDVDLTSNFSKYENIKTYGYKDCGEFPEMSIYDFENIKSPKTYASTSCTIEAACNNCLKHIQLCEFYKKKYLALKKRDDILKAKYNTNRKALLNLQILTRGRLLPKNKIDPQFMTNQIDKLNISLTAKDFAKMVLCRKSKTTKYSEEHRNIAQNVFFISPACYRFLRDNLELNLPSKNSILKWMPIKNLGPGPNENVVENLKRKVRNLSIENRNAVLLFDELNIRRDLEYDGKLDLIQGYTDDGNERKPEMAKYVLVFMVRGLFCQYKYILTYYASAKGISGQNLVNLINDNIKLLDTIGFQIQATVCDQGSNNRKAYTLLGVTDETPYFKLGGEERKIYATFDTPHLIKSIRNNLMQSQMETPDGTVSWNVIKEIYESEKNSSTKLCPKLTYRHIYPNTFEKMRVTLATQVFSRTVAAAIRTRHELQKFTVENEKYALATANFCEKIDKLFDNLNSKTLYSKNSNQCALKENNYIVENLKFMKHYISRLKCQKKSTNFCFKGLITTINSILQLSNDLFQDNHDRFIITCRFNQDPLENTFSIIRGKGGNSKNPSILEFNRTVAQIMCIKLLKNTNLSNCENDEEENLSGIIELENKEESTKALSCEGMEHNDIPDEATQTEDFIEIADSLVQPEDTLDGNIDDASLKYYIGYVFFKCNKKIKCESCKLLLLKSDETMSVKNESFIYFKNYCKNSDFGSLNAPSELFFNFSKHCVKIFSKIFTNTPHIRNIKNYINDKCIEIIKSKSEFVNILNQNNECYDHHYAILDFMILVLLRKHSKWVAKKNISQSKLLILKG